MSLLWPLMSLELLTEQEWSTGPFSVGALKEKGSLPEQPWTATSSSACWWCFVSHLQSTVDCWQGWSCADSTAAVRWWCSCHVQRKRVTTSSWYFGSSILSALTSTVVPEPWRGWYRCPWQGWTRNSYFCSVLWPIMNLYINYCPWKKKWELHYPISININI